MMYLLIFVYFLSAVFYWWYMHLSHSGGGIHTILTPGRVDVFIMFCPVVNTLACLFCWLCYYPTEVKFYHGDYNKFFNVKKKEL